MTISADYTFFIQIALFVVMWYGLKRLLFDPMVRLLEERERRTIGAREEAQRLSAAAELSGAEYEHRLQELRHTLSAEADADRAATLAEEQRVLSAARDEAGTRLAQLREALERDAAAARPALATEARQLAGLMLERVAGRGLA
jgi:F-type H+-transporting ATPase subunit b